MLHFSCKNSRRGEQTNKTKNNSSIKGPFEFFFYRVINFYKVTVIKTKIRIENKYGGLLCAIIMAYGDLSSGPLVLVWSTGLTHNV